MEESESIRSGRKAGDARPRARPARAQKAYTDATPEGAPKLSVRISEGLRKPLKRTRYGRRSVAMWPAQDDAGQRHFMLQFRTGGLIKHVMLSAEAVAAIAELRAELTKTQTLAFRAAWRAVPPTDGAPLRQDETDASPRGGDSRSEGIDT